MRTLSHTTESLCWHMAGGAVVYPQGSDFARPSSNLIARQEKPPE